MTSLELRVLGSLVIHRDGAPVTSLKSKKGQALLCYLAMTGEAWSRPTLAGLFWPEMPEANALVNLRKALHLLKQALAPNLLISRQAIAFNRTAATWLDVTEFEAAVAGKPDSAALQRASELYRGDFLSDLYLPDCDQFEEWAGARRVGLRQQALDALARLAEQELQQANYESAERHARRQLEIDNLRERGHRQLMEALASRGQRTAALRQYETCRHILATELGVDPAPATARLAGQIRQNQVGQLAEEALGTPASVSLTAPAVSGKRRPHLAVGSTPLIGRDGEMAELGAFLADPRVRLVTLVGPAGIGKSSLALAAAEREHERFAHGVFVVELAPAGSSAQQAAPSVRQRLVTRIADAVGYRFQEERRDPEQQLLDYLSDRALCLVLDNFEHLDDGAPLLADILQAAPRVKIVVTSREALHLYEEQIVPVTGLAFREGLVAEDDAAVQLFLQRARRLRPDFALREADMPQVTAICRLVGGMPLALELAAAQVSALSLSDMVGELERSLDLLATEWRNVPVRHRSMRAALDASWSRLTREEQQVFRCLSVCRSGFTWVAAGQVCVPEMSPLALRRILAGLAAKSFLSYQTAPDRYAVHELLRQFGAEKLALHPELETVARDRHSAYFCAFLEERTGDWYTARQIETLKALQPEAENVRRAWEWALAQGEWERLAGAIDSWRWYHQWRLHISDFDHLCQAIVSRTESQAAAPTGAVPGALRLRAKALTWLGWSTPNRSDALLKLEEALALLQRPELSGQDTRLERALALRERALRLIGMGDLEAAQESQEQSLALFEALGHQWGIAQSLSGLGLVDWRRGNYDAALARMESALVIRQHLGDRRAEGESKHGLGLIHRSLGHLDEAEQLLREALELGRRVDDPMALTRYKINLARTLLWRGSLEEAQRLARECLAMGQEHAYPVYEGWSRSYLAEILLHSGQYRQARRQAERARLILNEHKATLRLPDGGTLHLTLGELAIVEASYAEAEAAFVQSKENRDRSWDRQSSLLALAGLGHAARCLGRLATARQYLGEALATSVATKSYGPLVYTLPFVALLLASSGQVERGVAIWELARTQPFVAHSHWFGDVAGRELAALTATLPSAARGAARAQSRAPDLWQTAAELTVVLQE